MPRPAEKPDMILAIQALLASREAGEAVAKALHQQQVGWATRGVVADLRARRAQNAYETEIMKRETRRMAAMGSPWTQTG